jgi:hypothetical protein
LTRATTLESMAAARSSSTPLTPTAVERSPFEEYRRFLLIYGMDASHADEDFARLESDADGALTREEFSEIMLQYFRSEDLDERGNFLFAEH